MPLVGRKQFFDGEVPVAADLNDLAAQCIQVFDTAADRDIAYPTLNPADPGELVWIADSAVLQYYDGLNWQRLFFSERPFQEGRDYGHIRHRWPLRPRDAGGGLLPRGSDDEDPRGMWHIDQCAWGMASGNWTAAPPLAGLPELVEYTPSVVRMRVGESRDVRVRIGKRDYVEFWLRANTSIATWKVFINDGTPGPVARGNISFLSFSRRNRRAWNLYQTIRITGVAPGVTTLTGVSEKVTTASVSPEYQPINILVVVEAPEFVVSPADLSGIIVGSTRRFNVRLAEAPDATLTVALTVAAPGIATPAPASLTFTRANWNMNQSVVVTGNAVGETTLTVTATGWTPKALRLSVLPLAEWSVTPQALNMQTGQTQRFQLLPARDIIGAVSASIRSADTGVATVSPSTVTFTESNAHLAVPINVTGVTPGGAQMDITAPNFQPATVSVTVGALGVLVVAPKSISIDERQKRTVSVRLGDDPGGPVTVRLESLFPAVATLDKPSLTFTGGTGGNWGTNQQFEVTGVARGVTGVHVSASGYLTEEVVVSVATPRFVFAPTSQRFPALSTGAKTLRLASQPPGNITAKVTSTDTDHVTVSPADVLFTSTNWNRDRAITPYGVAAGTADIQVTAPGYETASATVVVDPPAPGDFIVSTELVLLTDLPTGSSTFTVRPSRAPLTGSLTVTVESRNTGVATVDKSTLTFDTANWQQAQVVTVTGLTGGTAPIALNAPFYNEKIVTATVTHVPLNVIEVDQTTLSVPETWARTFNVTLSRQPPSDVSVAISNGNPTVASADHQTLVFTRANWSTAQPVVVTGEALGRAVFTMTATGWVSAEATVTVLRQNEFVITSDYFVVQADTRGQTRGFHPLRAVGGLTTATFSIVGLGGAVALNPTTLTWGPSDWMTFKSIFMAVRNEGPFRLRATAYGFVAGEWDFEARGELGAANAIILSASVISVAPNSTTSFTAQLAQQPSRAQDIAATSSNTAVATVDGPLHFPADAYNVPQSFNVTSLAKGEAVIRVAGDATQGGALTAASVTIVVEDQDVVSVTPELTVSPSALTVQEMRTEPITVGLTAAPTSDVTVTATSDSTANATVAASVVIPATGWTASTTRTLQVTGVAAGSAVISLSASGGGATGTGTVDVTVTRAATNVPQAIQVQPVAARSVDVGQEIIILARLATAPTERTIVTATPSSGLAGRTTVRHFTPSNWGTYRPFIFRGRTAGAATVTFSASGLTDVTVSVTVAAVTTTLADFVLSESTADLTVGGNAVNIGVRLAAVPAGDVTASVASNSGVATVIPATLEDFTRSNWTEWQYITIAPVRAGEATVRITATGYNDALVGVAVTAPQAVGTIVASAASVAVDEESTVTFNVGLAAAPAGNVTVSLASDNPGVASASPGSIVMTPSNFTGRTVTITGVTAGGTTIRATAGGYTSDTVGVTVNAITRTGTLDVTPTTLTATAGATTTLRVRLGEAPTGNVTVTLLASTLSASFTGARFRQITFNTTNWNAYQSVTITADDAGQGTIGVIAPGYTPVSVPFNFEAAATTWSVRTVPSRITVPAGGVVSAQVLATGPTASFSAVGVRVSNTGVATVTPASGTPTLIDRRSGQYGFGITITGIRQGLTLLWLSGTGLTTVRVSVVVTAGNRVILNPTGILRVGLGLAGNLTARLSDALAAGESRSVVFSSSNTAVQSAPPALSFVQADAQTDKRVALAVVRSVGSSVLTASGAGLTADSVTVNSFIDRRFVVSKSALTIPVGGSDTFTFSLASRPSATVTASVTSSPAGRVQVTASSRTFTTTLWRGRTVTVTGLAVGTTTISITAPGYATATVSVTVTAGQAIRVLGLPFRRTSFGRVTPFAVSLAHAPTGSVSASIQLSDRSSRRSAGAPVAVPWTWFGGTNYGNIPATARTTWGNLIRAVGQGQPSGGITHVPGNIAAQSIPGIGHRASWTFDSTNWQGVGSLLVVNTERALLPDVDFPERLSFTLTATATGVTSVAGNFYWTGGSG